MTFGERLREERKRKGMNQTAFATIGGVTKTSQLNYEAGERSPNVDYLQSIAAIGVDVQYILTGEKAGSVTVHEKTVYYSNDIPMRRTEDRQLMAINELFYALNDAQRKEICAVIEEKKRLNQLDEKVTQLEKKFA